MVYDFNSSSMTQQYWCSTSHAAEYDGHEFGFSFIGRAYPHTSSDSRGLGLGR